MFDATSAYLVVQFLALFSPLPHLPHERWCVCRVPNLIAVMSCVHCKQLVTRSIGKNVMLAIACFLWKKGWFTPPQTMGWRNVSHRWFYDCSLHCFFFFFLILSVTFYRGNFWRRLGIVGCSVFDPFFPFAVPSAWKIMCLQSYKSRCGNEGQLK